MSDGFSIHHHITVGSQGEVGGCGVAVDDASVEHLTDLTAVIKGHVAVFLDGIDDILA